MRVKELNNKVAHIAFAPASIYPCYLASATAAEQVDSSSRFVHFIPTKKQHFFKLFIDF